MRRSPGDLGGTFEDRRQYGARHQRAAPTLLLARSAGRNRRRSQAP
jgi:hypothetical protein